MRRQLRGNAAGAAGAVAVLVAALVSVSPAHALNLAGPFQHRSLSDPIAGRFRALDVTSDSGAIAVTPGSTTTVQATENWNLIAPTVSVSLSAGVLAVTTRCPGLIPENNCSVDLTITLGGPAMLDVRAGVGDVTVHDLSGDESLRTGVGSVSARAVRAASLDFESGSGDLVANLPTPPQTLRMVAGVGDIHALVPAAAYALAISDPVGRVSVAHVTSDPTATHHITAKTGTGDIFITGS